MQSPGYRLIAVGVSAGGLQALRTLVGALPEGFEIPLAVVQHRSRDSELLCELLQECSAMQVGEVSDKEEIVPGRVYVAPPDYHLMVERGWFELSTDAPVRYSRPSVDVMFLSAADAYGVDLIGVVLTGANADGAAGLRRIVDRGGYAMVQDPATAEVRAMPQFAIRAVPEACVLPMEQIGPHLAAVRGSWTIATPPRAAICRSPSAPSSLAPVSTTPAASAPNRSVSRWYALTRGRRRCAICWSASSRAFCSTCRCRG